MDDLVKCLRGDSVSQENLWTMCGAAADRIEQLEAALQRIAQHDLQAIAMDALRPGERVPLEGKDD